MIPFHDGLKAACDDLKRNAWNICVQTDTLQV